MFEDDTRLLKRSPGRLLGIDGNRMSLANRNYLRLVEDELTIRRFIRRTLGRAVPPDTDIELASMQDIERGYFRLLGLPESQESTLSGLERIRLVEESLVQWLQDFRRRRLVVEKAFTSSRISTVLEEGEEMAGILIESRLAEMAKFT
ncbi:hypothetical protein KBX71_08650 [Micromonospora sp. D93]|uniref:hypothetical protein n=1 Tax=Micromonospora sp. D93 TaxID=2824886 RepID=UPI001B36923D|nr:hypothetical protein [Micromonospora sp. D93]MBQ1017933.1 hypothetical protein [Micromonospora sp. D93]